MPYEASAQTLKTATCLRKHCHGRMPSGATPPATSPGCLCGALQHHPRTASIRRMRLPYAQQTWLKGRVGTPRAFAFSNATCALELIHRLTLFAVISNDIGYNYSLHRLSSPFAACCVTTYSQQHGISPQLFFACLYRTMDLVRRTALVTSPLSLACNLDRHNDANLVRCWR